MKQSTKSTQQTSEFSFKQLKDNFYLSFWGLNSPLIQSTPHKSSKQILPPKQQPQLSPKAHSIQHQPQLQNSLTLFAQQSINTQKNRKINIYTIDLISATISVAIWFRFKQYYQHVKNLTFLQGFGIVATMSLPWLFTIPRRGKENKIVSKKSSMNEAVVAKKK